MKSRINSPLSFFQLPRSLSDVSSSSIYPWPRKMFAPNETNSSQNFSSNIVKNKERSLRETTYQGDYSNGEGLGSHVIYDTTPRLSPNEQLVRFIPIESIGKHLVFRTETIFQKNTRSCQTDGRHASNAYTRQPSTGKCT